MMYYEIKLINPETKEVYFKAISPKPQFPSQEVRDRYKDAMIVVRTISHPESD